MHLGDSTTLATDSKSLEVLTLLLEELRQPLKGLCDGLAVLETAEHLPGVIDRARRTIARHVGQIAVLVEALPSIATLSSGGQGLRRQRIDVAQVVAEAIDLCKTQLSATGRTVALQMPDAAVHCVADRDLMRQFVTHLIECAAHRTHDFGAIGLILQVYDDHIQLRVLYRETLPEASSALSCESEYPVLGAEAWTTECVGSHPSSLQLASQILQLHGGTLHEESFEEKFAGAWVATLPLDKGSESENSGHDRSILTRVARSR